MPAAIERCEVAGIRVVMITGDDPNTAASVAHAVGSRRAEVVIGSELPDDDDEMRTLLEDEKVGVLARIEPEQKLRIAKALQAAGHVVAMTGDGVNERPALRQADIGVAMGITGTDVAREVADLVLLDDNFAHIVEAVEEGRAAFDNTRDFLTYHLTDNVAELAPFVIWALSGRRRPAVAHRVAGARPGHRHGPVAGVGARRRTAIGRHRAAAPSGPAEHLLDGSVLSARSAGWPIQAVTSLGPRWWERRYSSVGGWADGLDRRARPGGARRDRVRVDRADADGERVRMRSTTRSAF